ncbi:MAG: Holliday junction resolvase RecU [Erysipelotrichaceae bacterium]|nr:Holliday junction resolvase RecU [Erysipelotrichaceae bacterium]
MNYPNGSSNKTTHLKSSSNRGMALEDDINITNNYYQSSGIANIHKKPTPVQIVRVDYPKRSAAKIVEAYFKLPSTTDYNGIYKGYYIDFEAKECGAIKSFPFSSIHKHQINHLKSIIKLGGIGFIILRFTKLDETFLIEAEKFIYYYENTKRASMAYTWIKENGYLIPFNYIKPVDYLVVIDEILEEQHGK